MTAQLALPFLIGLIAVKVLAPGFYARQDIKTPVKIGLATLLATQLMNLVFVFGLQLHHAGRESFILLKQGKAIAPSPIRSLVYGLTPREMTRDEIQEIILAFGSAALRAKEAGFDAVEVHGAHGYLLTQFLSALSNQRTGTAASI